MGYCETPGEGKDCRDTGCMDSAILPGKEEALTLESTKEMLEESIARCTSRSSERPRSEGPHYGLAMRALNEGFVFSNLSFITAIGYRR